MEFQIYVKEQPRTFIIHPVQKLINNVEGMTLSFKADESHSKILVQHQPSTLFNDNTGTLLTTCFGCLGFIQLYNEIFVIVISNCKRAADISKNQSIYKITEVQFFSLKSNQWDFLSQSFSVSPTSMPNEGYSGSPYGDINYGGYVTEDATVTTMDQANATAITTPFSNFAKLFSSGTFYFSPEVDLTKSFQELNANKTGLTHNNFLWNSFLIGELLNYKNHLSPFQQGQIEKSGVIVEVIRGYVGEEMADFDGTPMKFVIISKLSSNRVGTRYNARGIDDDGNVANFVETEFLAITSDHYFSFIQIRGSIPLFWEQQGVQMMGHKIQLSRSVEATKPAFEKHFSFLTQQYSRVHVVDLVNQSDGGSEQLLADSFRQQISELRKLEAFANNITFTQYDFHGNVKGSNLDDLISLTNTLEKILANVQFFLSDKKNGTSILKQNGVFRINCIDCLDRTNVVQTILCKYSLKKYFEQRYPKLPSYQYDACFQKYVSRLWSENGDNISVMYAGTGALKSELTKTGKRTLAGFIDDAAKTMNRFYINTFQDKGRQEVLDTLLGRMNTQRIIPVVNPQIETIQAQMKERMAEYSSTRNVTVHIATFNLNGQLPSGESLFPLLSFEEKDPMPDIVIVAFQEIVELTPTQIVSADPERLSAWKKTISSYLNNPDYYVHSNLKKNNPFINEAAKQIGSYYALIRSSQLVGAAMLIYVRCDQLSIVRNVETAYKKTGLSGLAGNKGGIAVRMNIGTTTICFVTAHLAAGHTNIEDRNRDYWTITQGLTFNQGRKIEDHDYIVWFGDFNYRIDFLSLDQVKRLIREEDFKGLYMYDQLRQQMTSYKAFPGFLEGTIKFLPTYKFDNGTNTYDTSEKMRIPAWTDRILFKGKKNVRQLGYTSIPILVSDHKPVKSLLEMEVNICNEDRKEKVYGEIYRKITGMEYRSQKPNTSNPSVYSSSPLHIADLIDFSDDSIGSKGSNNIISQSLPSRIISQEEKNSSWWCDFESAQGVSSLNPTKKETGVLETNIVKPALPPRKGTERGNSSLSQSNQVIFPIPQKSSTEKQPGIAESKRPSVGDRVKMFENQSRFPS